MLEAMGGRRARGDGGRRSSVLAALLAVLVVAVGTSACSSDGGSDGAGRATTTAPTTDPAPSTPATGETTTEPAAGDDERLRDPADVERLTDIELATEAYVAGYPLVVSTRTMRTLGGLVGVNRLFWQTALSGPTTRVVVAPNRDTLYSIAVLDLRAGPLVLTLPEVEDRYFTYQFLSPWTESFAYVGTRATGGEAGSWVIAPPGWDGDLPAGATLIEAPTDQVFLLGRFLVDDEADIPNVLAIRDRSSLRPLADVEGTPTTGTVPPLPAAAGRPQDVPTDRSFYDELTDALVVNPPTTPYQRALFAAFAEAFTPDPEAPPAAEARRRGLLDRAAEAGAARVQRAADEAPVVDGWRTRLDVGTYGDDLDLRASVARGGWGANVAAEAVYPVARTDATGAALDGSRPATITFPPGGLPATDDLGFWSLTVYGADLFFEANPTDRYAIGDRTPDLAPSPDGSVTITLAHDRPPEPADGTPVNWLPVPAGAYVLMLRIYLPGADVLDGTYRTPPVVPTP